MRIGDIDKEIEVLRAAVRSGREGVERAGAKQAEAFERIPKDRGVLYILCFRHVDTATVLYSEATDTTELSFFNIVDENGEVVAGPMDFEEYEVLKAGVSEDESITKGTVKRVLPDC